MTETMASITPEWIKQVRVDLDLTQEQFAARLGVSQGTVALWESGDRNPSGSAKILLEMLGLEAERTSHRKISA